MSSAPSHTVDVVGFLVMKAVEAYTANIVKDLDQAYANYREALHSAEPVRARAAYKMVGELGGLAANLVNLMEHSLKRVRPEHIVGQMWGNIDTHLRYHVVHGDEDEEEEVPLHTLLMDILNSVSFRVSGYGSIKVEGEFFPKLPEESDARAYARLTKDLSSSVVAQFRGDVFSERRRTLLRTSRETSRERAAAKAPDTLFPLAGLA
jgi:hypothetical protein